MTILFYINAIHHGGAERVMVNLSSYFSKNNKCIWVTSFEDTWEYSLNENVERINLCDDLKSNFILKNLELTYKLRKVIKKYKPDLVVSFMAEPNFRSLIATLGLNTKKVISVRNDPNMEYSNILFKLLAKTLYILADGVVFQTNDAKEWFPKIIQKKSKIIFNPIDEMFYNKIDCANKQNIITTGRLVSQKNHKLLIKAFSRICNEICDDLYIYGEGELESELLDLINELHLNERVFLPGATKNVVDVLSKSKIFVLSSDYEGLPNSLMEAMAMKLPCISSDCPCGGPKILLKNNSKYLFKVGNEIELAEKLRSLLTVTNALEESAEYSEKCSADFKSDIVYQKWSSYLYSLKK